MAVSRETTGLVRRYVETIGVVALATLARALVHPFVENRAPWVFYFPAIAIAAWRYETYPGLLAIVLSTLTGWYLWVPPTHSFAFTEPKDFFVVLTFIISGLLLVGFGAAHQKTLHRLDLAQAALASHSEALEGQVAAKTADLRAANAELEGFTYSVSHDMRAPLRAIIANASILLDDNQDKLDEESVDRLRRMASAGKRMGSLVEDLLTYARLKKQAVRRQETNLAALFRDVASEELAEIPGEFIAPETAMADCEPGMMRMVLQNLVGNAVKYRRAEVPFRIELLVTENSGERLFEVKDNGIGFDMEYVKKLFEPFERLHRNDEYPGTGIGLANVKRIVERHGGRVWARGELGKGATFGFTIADEVI